MAGGLSARHCVPDVPTDRSTGLDAARGFSKFPSTGQPGRLARAAAGLLAAVMLALPGSIALGQDGEPDAPAEEAANANASDEGDAEAEAEADTDTEADGEAAGQFYPVSSFDLVYLKEHPGLPATSKLLQARVRLVHTSEGYVAPQASDKGQSFKLSGFQGGEIKQFSRGALQQVFGALSDELMSRDLRGVFAGPHPKDIDRRTGEDLRPADRTALRVTVYASIINEVRTLGQGDRVVGEDELTGPVDGTLGKLGWGVFNHRIAEDERVNHPAHREIRQRSPVKGAGEDRATGDLLRGQSVDEFVYRMSRHTGRQVQPNLAPSPTTGEVTLDYQVQENKPWGMYFQLNNTGTANTDRLRQQFGVFDNQFTGNDDIFRLEYLTAGFEDTNAINTYYEAPVMDSETLRWAVNANYSEFTASDVGAFGDTFTGESWEGGAELIGNVYQRGRFFADVYGGARFTNIRVDSTLPGDTEGEEDFLLPRVGARYEANSRWYSHTGDVGVEWHSGAITDPARREINNLGRFGADEDWARLHWNFSSSMFLEPILNPEGWQDPSTPESSKLAHELALSFRGQSSFGGRLIPQMQQTAGGLYTVRGYPEALVAGDRAFIGSLEYRFHLPQVLGVEPQPREVMGGPFRFAPQYPYGVADWDLVPRVFIDAAHIENNSGGGFPAGPDETLVGAGVGVDLALKQNLRFSVDWGFALQEAQGYDRGNERVHFNFVVFY